jgi:hypothetical protein
MVALGDERCRLWAQVLAFDEQVVVGDVRGRGVRAVADAGGLADLAFEVGAFLGQLDPGGDVGVEWPGVQRSVGRSCSHP